MANLTMEELLALPLGEVLNMSGCEEGSPLMVTATLEGVPCSVFIVAGASDVEKLKVLAMHWATAAAKATKAAEVPTAAADPKPLLS